MERGAANLFTDMKMCVNGEEILLLTLLDKRGKVHVHGGRQQANQPDLEYL